MWVDPDDPMYENPESSPTRVSTVMCFSCSEAYDERRYEYSKTGEGSKLEELEAAASDVLHDARRCGTPDQQRQAERALAQAEGWASSMDWPGDRDFEALRQQVLDLREDLGEGT